MAEHEEPSLRVIDRRWWARGNAEHTGEDQGEARVRKPTQLEELERLLAERSTEIQNLQVEHRRALEEFEQVKARLRRDLAKEVERGRRLLLVELLDVVDNLDRAVAAGDSGGDETRLAQGVELVRDQFLAKLHAFGVARGSALGERFDATRHEAVTIAPVTSPDQDGVVIAVLKEGYTMGNDVLRPAAVVVGRAGG